MDVRTYLSIEVSLYRRLLKTWRERSQPIYAEIKQACADKNWARARVLVPELDMLPVGLENKEYIKYMLFSMGLFGANMASNGQPTFVSTGNHDAVMNQATSVFLQYLDHAATAEVQSHILQLIADSEATEPVIKADKRYVKPFVSFEDPGEGKLQLIASLHASRLATWGFAAEAEVRSITKYKLWNVMDGRTSKFCAMINGTVFEVEDARRKVNEVLQVQDPEDLRTVQPWPSQTKDAIAQYKAMSPEELSALGLMIPPFHPLCRTVCVTLERHTGRTPAMPISSVVPKNIATLSSFKELGIDVTEEELQKWNSYIGMSPVDYLSAQIGNLQQGHMTGKVKPAEEENKDLEEEEEAVGEDILGLLLNSAKDKANLDRDNIFSKKYKKSVKFNQNGAIETQVEGNFVETPFKVNASFDYYTGNYNLDQADMVGSDFGSQKDFLRKMFEDTVDVASSAGAVNFTVEVAKGDADSFVQLGFLPSPLAWQTLRLQALDDIHSPDTLLGQAMADLNQEQQNLLVQCLEDNDEHALEIVINLPWVTDNGVKISKVLLSQLSGQFAIDLTDKNAVATLRTMMAAS